MSNTIGFLGPQYAPTRGPGLFDVVKFTVGAPLSHVINVACQLQDAKGRNIAQVGFAKVYLSDSADGHTLTATALTSNFAIGTNGVILATPVSEKYTEVISNAIGQFDLNLTQTATQNYYLCVVLHDGSLAISPIIAFP
jgi:hypothetical protein